MDIINHNFVTIPKILASYALKINGIIAQSH